MSNVPAPLQKFKQRYSHVHPLIFQRTLENVKTLGDRFDVLETLPNRFPIVWDDSNDRWSHTTNIYQQN